MEYVRVAKVGEVASGAMIPVEAKGQKLLLALAEGKYFAAQRKCPHLGFNLCRGKLDGASVVCVLHKAKFSLESGAVERDPRLWFLNLSAKHDLTTYPVEVVGEDILVGV